MNPYFQDDVVTLYRGDCLEVMPSLSVDAVIADPPYGTTQCKWDAVIPFGPMWANLKRVTSGVIALCASQPFTSALVMSNPEMFKHEWIWIKNRGSNFANTVREPMKERKLANSGFA
jgi:DNA modification methylase